MKKTFKLFLSILVLGALISSSAFAQSYPGASFSSDEGMKLSASSPLVEKYEIDFTNYNWTEDRAEEAAAYFDDQSELILIEVDYPNLKLILKLDLDAEEASNWTLVEWSEHLATIL